MTEISSQPGICRPERVHQMSTAKFDHWDSGKVEARDQPLNFEVAWGLPGQPYFCDAQDVASTTRVSSVKTIKNLFFM